MVKRLRMSKQSKSRAKKAGMAPGSLVHTGKVYRQKARITVFHYTSDTLKENAIRTTEDCLVHRKAEGITWINVDGIQDIELLEKLGASFGLHPLVLEDIVNTAQRPKLEEYDNYIYIVLKMLYLNRESQSLASEQVSLVLGDNFVLSFQEGDENLEDVFEPIRERLRISGGKLRRSGADFLMYSLLDALVDNYFLVLEALEDRADITDGKLSSGADDETLKAIRDYKRESLFLHKTVWPLRELTSSLLRYETNLIDDTTRLYLRDVNDHTVQLIDGVEMLRDTLSGMMDLYLTTLSHKLNEVMKILTIISTVFMPLSFIAGVYGMNFLHMPELSSPFGYPAVLLIMAVVAFFMLRYFKKKKWF